MENLIQFVFYKVQNKRIQVLIYNRETNKILRENRNVYDKPVFD